MANYCPRCGIDTSQDEEICPSCGFDLTLRNNDKKEPPSFCMNCGTAVNPNNVICPKCGTNLNNFSPENKNKKQNSGCGNYILIIGITFAVLIMVIGSLSSLALPNLEKARDEAVKKSCFSNQRLLTGAVEIYNMDAGYDNQMHSLDIEALRKGKYLKYELKTIDHRCKYESEGDLMGDGYIKCRFHGPIYGPSKK